MKSIKLILMGCFLSLSYFTVIGQQSDNNVLSVADKIEYDYFFKHLKYLASDELKGRMTGSEGFSKAADYVANEFKNIGLQPFGDDGTYFQKVSLSEQSIVKSSLKLQVKKNSETVSGVYGNNISVLQCPRYRMIDEKQKLVFVGYGNILPEENINDYKGLNVKGKTVIVALGSPKSIKNATANDPLVKVQAAVDQGASGIIVFYPKRLFQNMIFKNVQRFLERPMISLSDTTLGGAFSDLDFKIGVFAKLEFINSIFELNGLKLEKELKKIENGNSSSKELVSVINCTYETTTESIYCKNVIAMIPGNDPFLKKEYVVIGAHLDHLGIGKQVKGDSIYNGMWDNASGSAAIISVAKAHNDISEQPKRSVIFVCYTAEEIGLLGSHFFASKNEIKDGRIIANINVDMLGSLSEIEAISPIGYSYSNLSEAVDYSAKILNLGINKNRDAEDEFVGRSDQFSFIKKGIPALNCSSIDPKSKSFKKWMKKKYHSPIDDLNQKYSDKAFLTAIRYNFLISYYVTNILEEAKWNTESKIYKRYVLKEKY